MGGGQRTQVEMWEVEGQVQVSGWCWEGRTENKGKGDEEVGIDGGLEMQVERRKGVIREDRRVRGNRVTLPHLHILRPSDPQ